MNDSKIKAILFDKDGVLVDFQATYGSATREIMHRLGKGDDELFQSLATEIGFSLSDDVIHPLSPLVGGCALDICAVWAGVLGIANSREFQISVDDMFKQLTETGVVLINGVGAELKTLGKAYQLGLATNDTEACARAQLTHAGVVGNFGFLCGYDSGHGPKPGTGMAKAFLAHTKLNADQVVMVGDSVHDMNFAKAAGMTAIGLPTGPLPTNELAPYANHMIASLNELLPLVELL